jgi:hypothetical protein
MKEENYLDQQISSNRKESNVILDVIHHFPFPVERGLACLFAM